MLVVLKAAAAYFAAVFGAGFILGTVRVLLLVPRLGTRAAELLEMPIMFIVIVLSARWIVRRFELPPGLPSLATGFLAFALLISAELTSALALQGLSPSEYFATRDPVSGAVYYLVLLVFAILPWWIRDR